MKTPPRPHLLIFAHGIPMLAPFLIWLNYSYYYPYIGFLQGTGPLGYPLMSLVGDYWFSTCILFGAVWSAIFLTALLSRARNLAVGWHFAFSIVWVLIGFGPCTYLFRG